MPLATTCKPVVDNEVTCFPNTPFIVYVMLMVHTKSNDCYTNIFGCESQVNIILLEFRSGWLSVSSSPIALSSSSKIITDRDFRDLSFERISFLLYLCSNRRSPLGLRELKPNRGSTPKPTSCRSPFGLRELKLRTFIRIPKFRDRSSLGLRESMLINCSGHDSNISFRLFGQKSIFIFDMSLVAQYSIIKY